MYNFKARELCLVECVLLKILKWDSKFVFQVLEKYVDNYGRCSSFTGHRWNEMLFTVGVFH